MLLMKEVIWINSHLEGDEVQGEDRRREKTKDRAGVWDGTREMLTEKKNKGQKDDCYLSYFLLIFSI